jgi:hypothetical protein
MSQVEKIESDFEDDEDMEQGEEVVGHIGQQEALSKNKKKRKLSSDVWNYFHYEENKQSSLFTVNCKYCTYKTVKPLKDGTSNLRRHIENCNGCIERKKQLAEENAQKFRIEEEEEAIVAELMSEGSRKSKKPKLESSPMQQGEKTKLAQSILNYNSETKTYEAVNTQKYSKVRSTRLLYEHFILNEVPFYEVEKPAFTAFIQSLNPLFELWTSCFIY